MLLTEVPFCPLRSRYFFVSEVPTGLGIPNPQTFLKKTLPSNAVIVFLYHERTAQVLSVKERLITLSYPENGSYDLFSPRFLVFPAALAFRSVL